ncbi:putative Concanavalin A-like lectin protein kinase family protein [Hibiscus syriacus]|uniref:Concanavalin A-like lectin protein kinase family protein n=1 Tax=Hibiscus syriacus TaxID=106335 RepID=A0A6A3AG52_HIBSY|nr:putative Concanavalin A-like lectin protein kinase family protein [Hibiscus syriacus]
MRYFWKGSDVAGSGARVGWSQVCTPKSEGGLGLLNLVGWNKVCLVQLLRKLFEDEGSLWVAWVRTYIVKDVNLWSFVSKGMVSWSLRRIFALREEVVRVFGLVRFQGVTRAREIWEEMRTWGQKVAWKRLVWFPLHVLRHAIIVWMATCCRCMIAWCGIFSPFLGWDRKVEWTCANARGRFSKCVVLGEFVLEYLVLIGFIIFIIPTMPEMVYESDAYVLDNAIQLTGSNGDVDGVGRATYYKPMHLWDNSSWYLTLAYFTTHFSFSIDSSSQGGMSGDGLTFFLAPNGSKSPPTPEAVAWDFKVATRSQASTALVLLRWSLIRPGSQITSVLISTMSQLPSRPSSGGGMTLKMGDRIRRGHRRRFERDALYLFLEFQLKLTSFQALTNPPPTEAPAAAKIPRRKSRSWLWVVLAIAGAISALIPGLGSVWFFCRRRKYISREDGAISVNVEMEMVTAPRQFSYKKLRLATGNFSDEGLLGRAVSGRNLAQLIGWCHDNNEFLIVYEFLPNKSLDYHLHREPCLLTWDKRYKIAMGLASALLYLQEECDQCVLHRDIKSSNVLLDLSFNAKLGDFGLARLVEHGQGSRTTKFMLGTDGYIAPECLDTHRAVKESDIYSFGIVILEIASGKKAIAAHERRSKKSRTKLVEWVWELYGKESLVDVADQRLYGNYDMEQMERLLLVGLACAHPGYFARPSITQVIDILGFKAPCPMIWLVHWSVMHDELNIAERVVMKLTRIRLRSLFINSQCLLVKLHTQASLEGDTCTPMMEHMTNHHSMHKVVPQGRTPERDAPNLQTQAIMHEMARLLKLELEPSYDRIDQFEASLGNRRVNRPRMKEEFEEEEAEVTSVARRDAYRNQNDNFSNIKVTIPPFQGRTDPEAYLDLHYVEIEEMVHVAMKIERQLKRKSYTKSSPSSATKWKQEPITFRKPIPAQTKDHIEVTKTKQVGESSKDSDEPIFDEEPETKQDEETKENADHGEMLVSKRCLQSQTSQEDIQRNNIFHTRCHVKDKVCTMIIDGGSCTNVASTLMVEKLELATSKHPTPYKLQCLNEGGELNVTKHVLIPFSVGRYKDEVTLMPLTPKEVQQDQLHMQKSVQAWRKDKTPIKNEEERNMTPNFFIEKHDGSRLENEEVPTKIGDDWNLKTQLFTKGFNHQKLGDGFIAITGVCLGPVRKVEFGESPSYVIQRWQAEAVGRIGKP